MYRTSSIPHLLTTVFYYSIDNSRVPTTQRGADPFVPTEEARILLYHQRGADLCKPLYQWPEAFDVIIPPGAELQLTCNLVKLLDTAKPSFDLRGSVNLFDVIVTRS